MNTENPNTNDLHDRLLDHALRETLGGEAPPDLTQQILTAAGEQSSQLSTLATGDEAMNGNHEKTRKARKYWAVLAVAASLLVATGFLMRPNIQAARESTRLTQDVANNKREIAGDNKKPVGTTVELPEFEVISVESTVTISDGGTILLSGIKRLPEARKKSGEASGEDKKLDRLIMGVTPRIIIQEGEEERLGIESADNMGLEGLINDAYAATPESRAASSASSRLGDSAPSVESRPKGSVYGGLVPDIAVDLDTPGRQNTFGFATPVTHPDAKVWEELTRRRKKYDSVDLSAPQGSKGVYNESLEGVEPNVYFTDGAVVAGRLNLDSSGMVDSSRLHRQSKDKNIEKFKNEKYALAQQLRQMQATTRGGNSQQIKKLRERYARIEREEWAFRQTIDEEGSGPGTSGDQYTRIYENPFITAEGEAAVSTFSIDVDTASYANVRQFLMQSRRLPPPDAVRIEELVNYFDYDYSGPTGDVPFTSHIEIAGCPWNTEHRLLRIGIKGREVELENRPQSNLVFLIDVSGSMNGQAKLPLLIKGMKMLVRELGENDRVAIVVYASSEGLALDSTRGDRQDTILAALEKLRAGGSTAGGAGIQLAYQIAEDNFIEGGTNRVILATDGDFNVGTTSTAELERLAELKAKQTGVFLTVLGFGRGNLNDAMMEAISGKGNGNYHYIDNQKEARKVLVEEMTGTLLTIAKDVKIQIEFNPAQVAGYRLIGYENRMLRTEDFNDDKKDAGEIGAGHTVTALYEIVPAGKAAAAGAVDALKYQTPTKKASDGQESDDLLTLKIRYKRPDGETSSKVEFPITDSGQSFAEASDDFKFAAAVASFGMLLRDSEHRGTTSLDAVLEIAEEGSGRDPHGHRAEFLQLVRRAKELRGE